MAAVYEKHAITTEEYVRAFECAPLQAGVAFVIPGQALGLDLFDHPHTLNRLFAKLVRSYALDALEAAGTPAPEANGTVSIERVLEAIATAPSFAQPSVGLGKDIRFSVMKSPAVRSGPIIVSSTPAPFRPANPARTTQCHPHEPSGAPPPP